MGRFLGRCGAGQSSPQSPGCPHPCPRLTDGTGCCRGTPPPHRPVSVGSPAPGGWLAELRSCGSAGQGGGGAGQVAGVGGLGEGGAECRAQYAGCACALHTSGALGSQWHPLALCNAQVARPYPAARLGRCTHFSMASMVFSSFSPDPVGQPRWVAGAWPPSSRPPPRLITPVCPG